MPQFKILRVVRMLRVIRLLREVGPRRFLDAVLRIVPAARCWWSSSWRILLLEFGATAILAIELQARRHNIKDASDALWYVYVTVTTVGYGDRYPVSNAGRFIGVLIMTVGVGLFGTLTGFLANAFVSPARTATSHRGLPPTTPRPKSRLSWPRFASCSRRCMPRAPGPVLLRRPRTPEDPNSRRS